MKNYRQYTMILIYEIMYYVSSDVWSKEVDKKDLQKQVLRTKRYLSNEDLYEELEKLKYLALWAVTRDLYSQFSKIKRNFTNDMNEKINLIKEEYSKKIDKEAKKIDEECEKIKEDLFKRFSYWRYCYDRS